MYFVSRSVWGVCWHYYKGLLHFNSSQTAVVSKPLVNKKTMINVASFHRSCALFSCLGISAPIPIIHHSLYECQTTFLKPQVHAFQFPLKIEFKAPGFEIHNSQKIEESAFNPKSLVSFGTRYQ